ncbi:hypothetical protein [Phenylobacterium sp.]|uniref:hypothetical protein n=1 Tax=Phenylobacterium sp. TaxID=1871053 RepID=UPI0035699A8F
MSDTRKRRASLCIRAALAMALVAFLAGFSGNIVVFYLALFIATLLVAAWFAMRPGPEL